MNHENQNIEEFEREQERLANTERRERIATAALSGMLSCGCWSSHPEEVAPVAVEMADALIAELDKGKP